MWNNVYAFDNKTDYLLHTQLDKVAFAKRNVTSQLESVRKRSHSLSHDMIIYLIFIFVPLFASFIGFIVSFLGNLILRIFFVPILMIGVAGTFILTPYGLYKFCIGGLMILFSRHGGSMEIFGRLVNVYTYKSEENLCLGKLHKLTRYEKQLLTWQKALQENGDVPDYHYIENVCDKMDLDDKVKVATMEDPIMKHFGKLFFVLFLVSLVIIVIGTWTGIFLGMGKMMGSYENKTINSILEEI